MLKNTFTIHDNSLEFFSNNTFLYQETSQSDAADVINNIHFVCGRIALGSCLLLADSATIGHPIPVKQTMSVT